MGHCCFGKVLFHTDITHALEIPSTTNYLRGHNNANMFVWDNGLETKRMASFSKGNELEEGETVRFYYIPACNSYFVEFEGPNCVQALQLFPLN
ncbi:hypothetical protein CsSME_00028501 [Camellia sinensis var. sinensis]